MTLVTTIFNAPEMDNSNSQTTSLHQCHVHKLGAILCTTHSLCHVIALGFIFYFRATFFFDKSNSQYNMVHFLPSLVIFAAELLFSFIWFLKQPFYWRPVTRTVFPKNLTKDDEQLPGIDVFICTADPKKEPTFEVMNTVISAMSLDYPANKLSVYLSDDANAYVTLNGVKEAWAFATWWLPFCRRYNVKSVCPRAYFGQPKEESHNTEFIRDRNILQQKYEVFKLRVQSKARFGDINGEPKTRVKDHPALIQVINANVLEGDSTIINTEHVAMPYLVYVSREKRPHHPHHFKAGALNVLLRVSAFMSDSPYILVLDCDMYCNDSISAREAMCFYLDPKISPTLGWVQYPQAFHNVSENDIYDSQMNQIWEVFWLGADGFQGPTICGTNFYINRKALYGFHLYNGNDIKREREIFGPSHKLFVKSIIQNDMPNEIKNKELCSASIQEAFSLASCTYEENTKWGEEVGFRYKSVAEDAMTGFMLQSKGWRSVYLNPKRPQFLGSATTNLNELLVQNTRWASGLVDIGLSKYCPLFCTPSRMPILQKISTSWVTLFSLCCIPIWCFAIVPPIGFLYGIPLYPKVSDPFFLAYAYVLISSLLKILCEIVTMRRPRGSVSTLSIVLNEETSWMIKAVTCHLYGVFDCIMAKLGLREASFIPTNKSEDHDTSNLYKMGKYDFRTSNMFLVPLVTIVILNMCCFVGGIARLTTTGDFDSMFAQAFFSIYVFVVGFPVIEAMFLRQDPGCIPLLVTLKSTLFSVILLTFGYLLLLY